MGSKVFKEETSAISGDDIESTLRHLSPIVGIPFESVYDKAGKVVKCGLGDLTMGTSAKNLSGEFGKTAKIGDIDIAIDESIIDKNAFIARLVKNLGPDRIGKPVNGGSTIPTKIDIGGNEGSGLVEVDFTVGNPDLLKFTHHAPSQETASSHNGIARNEMMRAILQDSRRQVRDPESKEIMALVGPNYFLDRGFIQEWRHFPMREDGVGRRKNNKPISRHSFYELYPDHAGNEKEMMVDKPQEMIEYLFPKANVKMESFESYETIRDLVIEHKPDRAESIFNLFVQGMQRKEQPVPEGLIVESRKKIEKSILLKEVRQVSMNRVMESIVRRGKFEDFRKTCRETLASSKKLDYFESPKMTADVMPREGLLHLITNTGLMNEWESLNKNNYGTNYHHKVNDFNEFYEDLCELVGEDQFFFVAEHYNIDMTPDSFVGSLIEMDNGDE
jgi:hypothetical protein